MVRPPQFRVRTLLLLQLAVGVGIVSFPLWWPYVLATTQHITLRPVDHRPIAWQDCTPESLDAAKRSGQPVLVFFGADWDMYKVHNLQVAVERPRIRRLIADYDVVPIYADYTQQCSPCEAELRGLIRFPMQLIAVYPPDASQRPILLPGAVKETQVAGAIEQATVNRVRQPPWDMFESPIVGTLGLLSLIALAHLMARFGTRA